MVNEVENILREIRERVQAEEAQNGSAHDLTRNVPSGDRYAQAIGSNEIPFRDGDSLARVSSHLTTTARTWDKLPPLFSNRKGGSAKFELWIKARLKMMSRWFTWEQVNFNSAVHHALTDTLQTLTAQAHELEKLRADFSAEISAAISKENEAWKTSLERETRTLHNQIESEIRRADTRTHETNTRLSEMRAEMSARLTELAQQIDTSHQRLLDQQRVCFEQLSLEVGEAARLEDRGRSAIESRLENLEKASPGQK